MASLTIKQFFDAANRLEHGFCVYDSDYNVAFANKASREHFPELFKYTDEGIDLRTAIGNQVNDTAPNLVGAEREAFIETTLADMKRGDEYEVTGSHGRIIRVYHSKTDGGATVGISIDVTDDKARKKELKKARKAAEAASAAKSEFLAAMSHEIRTPLNGILGMAQALRARDMSDDEQDMVNTILESSKSLMTILNDILDLSKIEAGKLDIAPVEGDLRHKLSRLQKFYLPMAEDKGLYLKLVIDPQVPSTLLFDPVRIRQCVSNLVSNALKFTQTGGIIVAVKSNPLKNDPESHRVTVHVSDTGIGIAKQDQAHLFAKFSQADASTTRNFGGTGLGLAIAQHLSRMMGGDIRVTSQLGKGSVFTLTFTAKKGTRQAVSPPREKAPDLKLRQRARPDTPAPAPKPASKQAEAASTGIAQASDKKPTRTNNSLNGLHVLIVDDNSVNRRVARLFVEPQGLTAMEAENGKEALELLASEPFDFVLLDMHMPVMDGRETIRTIRASTHQSWSDIPVIAMTADAMSGDREKCLGLGMDGYVPKPVDQRELFVEILNVMAAASAAGRNTAAAPAAPTLPPEVSLGEAGLDDLFDLASGE